MAYELEEIRKSQQIFYFLLKHHALREEKEPSLFKIYTEAEDVRLLVKSQAEEAGCSVERYGGAVYLIPDLDNDFLGYSKKQLKGCLCKSNATDRDYYLSQFVIITLLVVFYDGQGSSSKSRTYIRVGELLNEITSRLAEGVERSKKDEINAAEDGLAFSEMLEAFEALRSDDRGSRARTTKEGFLYYILIFFQGQGLIDFVEADEMIYTTNKLDQFMDWNLLNKNNYNRVLRVLEVTVDE